MTWNGDETRHTSTIIECVYACVCGKVCLHDRTHPTYSGYPTLDTPKILGVQSQLSTGQHVCMHVVVFVVCALPPAFVG